MADSMLTKYERWQIFTPDEAWGLFRIAAITEAVGWSLLISGILVSRYLTPGSNVAVQLAGKTHGSLFLFYIIAVIVLYPSQRWSRRRTLIASFASVPPYGSLVFELWTAHERRQTKVQQYQLLTTYHRLTAL
jgi:integral membrane protein